MSKPNDKRVVIMLPEASITKILEEHPEVEMQIADSVIASTTNRVIKKALNGRDLNEHFKDKVDTVLKDFMKQTLTERNKSSYYSLECRDVLKASVAAEMEPFIKNLFSEAFEEYFKKLVEKGDLERFITDKFDNYIRAIVLKKIDESKRTIQEIANEAVAKAIRDKLGM